MDAFEPGTTRDATGRFLPGASGNPAGKRPGTRNRKTVLAEALRDGEDNSIARVVIDKAIGGDAVTARFLLALMVPKPRGREIALDLPEDAQAGDVVAAFDATLTAMAAGEITPDEALIVTKVLDFRRRALETLALERRADAAATPEPAVNAASPDTAKPRIPLHSACISQFPGGHPQAERRLVGAALAQRRTQAPGKPRPM